MRVKDIDEESSSSIKPYTMSKTIPNKILQENCIYHTFLIDVNINNNNLLPNFNEKPNFYNRYFSRNIRQSFSGSIVVCNFSMTDLESYIDFLVDNMKNFQRKWKAKKMLYYTQGYALRKF